MNEQSSTPKKQNTKLSKTNPQVLVTLVTLDRETKKTILNTNHPDPDYILTILCSGIVGVIKYAKLNGDSIGDTQKRLDKVKKDIWNRAY